MIVSSILISLPISPMLLLDFTSKHPLVTGKQSVDKEEI